MPCYYAQSVRLAVASIRRFEIYSKRARFLSMSIFKKIFVAIDFSPVSDEALRHADKRAKSAGAQLAVCHVVPNDLRSDLLFPHISRIAALQIPLEMNQVADEVSMRVTDVTGRASSDFEVITDDGPPHALILKRAEEWMADLIVMGSQGQNSTGDAVLGSVTSSVLRHAHSPVLIVRAGKHSRSIVAGTDFSDPSLPAIKAAAEEAERTGSQLTVVHSLDLIWSPASYPAMAFGGAPFNMSQDQIQELEGIAKERLDDSLAKAGISGNTLVTTGPAGDALINVANSENSELIVVGTTGRTGIPRALLGSVAETVAKKAPCSVLVVRQHPE
jgi:nucleotide-binding universal stress UspA family protein